MKFCFAIFLQAPLSLLVSENSTRITKAKNSATHLLIAFNFATQGKQKPSKAGRVRNKEPDNRKLIYVGLRSPLPRQEANAGSRAGQLDQSSRGLESSCQLHVLGLAFLISLSIVNCLAGEALDGPRPYTLRLGTFQ